MPQTKLSLGIGKVSVSKDTTITLIYGQPGVGKSRLASTVKDTEKTLILDFEQSSVMYDHLKKADMLSIGNASKLKDVLIYLKQKPIPYDTLIIDGFSTMINLKTQQLRTVCLDKHGNTDVWEVFNKLSDYMFTVLKDILLNFTGDVILTCSEMVTKEGLIRYAIAGNKTGEHLNNLCTNILRVTTDVTEDVRVNTIQITPTLNIMAKRRVNAKKPAPHSLEYTTETDVIQQFLS